ncbi:hypothetical protein SAMN05216299_10810 [Nitrosospira sp. Nsp14]|nr:hypothetical protein SAMN05216299_10810 [Nitrosospira sp. Nsp14]
MGRLAIRAMCCHMGAPLPLIQRLQEYMEIHAHGLPFAVDQPEKSWRISEERYRA